MRTAMALLRLARPAQWTKNIFVFTALIFSGRVLECDAVTRAIFSFITFSIASSAIYFLNDYIDISKDRLHPDKIHRPLAAGHLPPWVGPAGAAILGGLALLITSHLQSSLGVWILTTYLLLNILYCIGLKDIVILDVLLISSGFVLRILFGAAAIATLPSTWLILCAVTVSLFLGFTKRRAEVVRLGDDAKHHRSVLAQYSQGFLDQAISIVTAATLVCYVLYTVDDHTVQMVGSRLMIFSVPMVLYGVFRYLYLVYHNKSGDDPSRTIFTDLPMLLTGVIWASFCTLSILAGNNIRAWFM